MIRERTPFGFRLSGQDQKAKNLGVKEKEHETCRRGSARGPCGSVGEVDRTPIAPDGFVVTVLLGISGASVGGFVFGVSGGPTGFHIWSIQVAALGAVILLFVCSLVAQHATTDGDDRTTQRK